MKGILSDVFLWKVYEFWRLIDILECDFKFFNGWFVRFKVRYGIVVYCDFYGEFIDVVVLGVVIMIFKLFDFVNCYNEVVEVDYIGWF